MHKTLLVVSLLTSFNVVAENYDSPTNGAINEGVTQSNITTTVCVSGYTKTIRPPTSYTNRVKKELLLTNPDKNMTHYELDHIIPLAVGGHPTNVNNLWAQPRYGEWNAGRKDVLESFVHRELCKGKLTLQESRNIFIDNWVDGYKKYIKRNIKLEHVD